MTYNQLQQQIAESDKKFAEMEAMLQQKIDIEMASRLPDRTSVLRMKEQISGIHGRALRAADKLKKEYAMQNAPADIGDVISTEINIQRKNGTMGHIYRLMRVERIEVAAFEVPSLVYYGTYLKMDGKTPVAKQIMIPIHQKDITKVVKATANKY